MKYTLIEMVKSIMSDMDSDAVDSISDTDEAGQVASTIRDVYFQLVTTQMIPEFYSLGQLTDAVPDALVYMQIPDIYKSVESIRYNVKRDGDTFDQFAPIRYVSPDSYLDTNALIKSDDTNVVAATDPVTGLTFPVRNDKPPEYWTSFDDKYIVFDSYDAAVDTVGLQAEKTRCWVSNNQDTFDITDDDFVPVMDDNFFPLLLAEAKSTCFVNLKQQANPKIERQARNQLTRTQNEKFRTRASEKASFNSSSPSYGRRRGSH